MKQVVRLSKEELLIILVALKQMDKYPAMHYKHRAELRKLISKMDDISLVSWSPVIEFTKVKVLEDK